VGHDDSVLDCRDIALLCITRGPIGVLQEQRDRSFFRRRTTGMGGDVDIDTGSSDTSTTDSEALVSCDMCDVNASCDVSGEQVRGGGRTSDLRMLTFETAAVFRPGLQCRKEGKDRLVIGRFEDPSTVPFSIPVPFSIVGFLSNPLLISPGTRIAKKAQRAEKKAQRAEDFFFLLFKIIIQKYEPFLFAKVPRA